MALQCIVLDFDGTFTQVEEEAGPFLAHFRVALAREMGRDITGLWDEAAQMIEQSPDAHGWRHEGHIVAPATADPFLWATSIGQIVLERSGLAQSGGTRSPLVDIAFAEAYALAKPVFRVGAREAIETVLSFGLPTFIVTNSRTDSVRAKLGALGMPNDSRLAVLGDARKFMLMAPSPTDARFDALPESEQLPGLSRPVMLRRGKYYEVLRRMWSETNASPETTLLCGDIFELDLAMPRRLGARVHLVSRASTPKYEIEAVRTGPRGSVSHDLNGFVARLRTELLAG